MNWIAELFNGKLNPYVARQRKANLSMIEDRNTSTPIDDMIDFIYLQQQLLRHPTYSLMQEVKDLPSRIPLVYQLHWLLSLIPNPSPPFLLPFMTSGHSSYSLDV